MNIFITGITGTVGTAIARLHSDRGDVVYGCARSERGVVRWIEDNKGLNARVFIGDASQLAIPYTDMGKLIKLKGEISHLYHCAAMKHVDICELQPQECYWQNITLTNLISQVCYQYDIDITFISSDKACLPESLYGATKLVAEKLVLSQGGAVVRLGNVIASSGSVIERWIKSLRDGRNIELTDPAMTRYFMTATQAAEFICNQSLLGYVAIPSYIRSIQMGELATYLVNKYGLCASSGMPTTIKEIGPRPGETTHQWLAPPGCRLLFDRVRTLLTDRIGTLSPNGMCSLTAQRWDIDNLLASSGIKV